MKYLNKILVLLSLVSCTVDNHKDGANMLYYSGVSEISPGTSINVTPSWYGETPKDFEISAILFEGKPFVSDCFSVDNGTGVFSISNSQSLSSGHYSISISCSFGGARKNFPDIITIHLMKPVPDGIVVSPSCLGIPLADILSGETDLPKAVVESDGSDHVAIKQFIIANVRRDGILANECKDWFSLSQEGVFSVVTGNHSFIPGTYTFDFRLTTYVVGKEDETGLFTNALTLDVTSPPLALIYPANTAKVERSYAAVSSEPKMTGSVSDLNYTLKGVSPSNAPGISIDTTNGVLTFPATEAVNVGDEYSVSVTVTNSWGATDFDNVFTFKVIDFIHPVTQLSYSDVGEKISGLPFSNPVALCDGDEVEYAFVDLPEGLAG